MNKLRILGIMLIIAVLGVGNLTAQSLKGMSFNGATGLYSIPTGRIGWERTSDLGLDFGYHLISRDGHATHIPKVSLSLVKFIELNLAVDIQPDPEWVDTNTIIGGKFQFPTNNRVAVAMGGNYQIVKARHYDTHPNTGQIYLAVTYPGKFFDWPAETTVVIGYTMIEDRDNQGIDFGMGFDLILLPSTFENFIHWILDFSNYTYATFPPGYAVNVHRGVLNTGIRIDFASIARLDRFKFAIDLLMTDAFDNNRSFSIGGVFGVGLK
jgi:hypothetical protein